MTNKFKFALVALILAVGCNQSYEFYGEEGTASFEVVEYTPAPGQFINEGYTATTMAEACAYAQQRFSTDALTDIERIAGDGIAHRRNIGIIDAQVAVDVQ